MRRRFLKIVPYMDSKRPSDETPSFGTLLTLSDEELLSLIPYQNDRSLQRKKRSLDGQQEEFYVTQLNRDPSILVLPEITDAIQNDPLPSSHDLMHDLSPHLRDTRSPQNNQNSQMTLVSGRTVGSPTLNREASMLEVKIKPQKVKRNHSYKKAFVTQPSYAASPS
jgi:hypothetical protein